MSDEGLILRDVNAENWVSEPGAAISNGQDGLEDGAALVNYPDMYVP